MADWLGETRTAAAAERILDAADELFTRQDAASVGMNDIATAAGCSRATLYRYFENREVLYTAYVHRETHRVFGEIGEQIAGVHDPDERLIRGMLTAVQRVRETPALASWFATTSPVIGGNMAEQSEVIAALAQGFLTAMGDASDVEARARWLIRILVSLMLFPGRDAADERAMLESFVVPVIGVRQPSRRAP
jgi:AcrR family transcriptional regulator